ncbi:MAG: zinc ABC transporter substrate-binding protein [Thermomicrobiales bacterium]
MTHSRRTFVQRAGIAMATAALGLTAAGISLSRERRSPAEAQDRLRVTTTVGMIADLVRNTGGDRVEVTALMGPGIDPHLYKPSARDIGTLSEADIIFYGGLHLEGRMVETFEGIARSGKPTFAVSASIPEDRLLAFGSAHDPHIWFDVSLWILALEEVTARLGDTFPDDAAQFRTNAAAYRTQLETLDAYVRTQAERVPEAQRVLVTAHDAFSYFGRAYGFEVQGLQGISTASEAGAGDVRALIDLIVERRIGAIFVESSVSPATIEAVQEGARARGWDVAIGGQLFSDAMGEDGTVEGTYIGMVTHNIDTIVGALLGALPDALPGDDGSDASPIATPATAPATTGTLMEPTT